MQQQKSVLRKLCQKFLRMRCRSDESLSKSSFRLQVQIVYTSQPSRCSFCIFISSRVLFFSILFRHIEEFVLGTELLLQSWPCQKQPFTNTATLYLGKTTSGFPGSFLSFLRKRNPCLNRNDRTAISGDVSFPRILDIFNDRASGER